MDRAGLEMERLLEMGDWEGARGALLEWLAERVAVGDETARVVVRVLGAGRFSADGVAGVVDRLVAVTEAQEGQIRALMALLEGRL